MFKPDSMIGPYTLISRLGRGAYGVVWLAEKRTAIATTKVAIKIANDDDVDLEAIRREASVWVSASGHPNVLPIIDADVYDEQVIIVSEYAPDGSMAKWLETHGGKAPTVESAIEMISGILAGLEHLHRREIIHRDLKPENILLQNDTPRLADFGIARLLKTTSQSAAASGTPIYMPPEAFDGKRSEQTDIWSAGVIFYQLLTGRLPFEGDDMASLIAAIITRKLEPLPLTIPREISEVIERSLNKDPAERYKSAGEMRRRLRDISLHNLDSDPGLAITIANEKNFSSAATLRAPSTAETEQQLNRAETLTPVSTKSSVELPDTFKALEKKKNRAVALTAAAVAALAIIIGAAAFLFFRNNATSSPAVMRPESEFTAIFRKKTDAWTDRVFTSQAAKGGIKELSANDETAQVWSTAQCMAAVLATQKNLDPYVPKIKNAFNFIEITRRTAPAVGWNYYGNSNPYTVTEIGGWVVLAEIKSLESKTKIWDDSQRQEILKRVVRDLDELKQRQDNSGGWRPIKDDYPDFTRTYSSVIALWSLIEARRSPAVNERIGTRYDDSIRRGINWLLLTYKASQGWVQNPNRVGQINRFDGLTAQALFVLSRAETIEGFAYIKNEQVYGNAKKEFVANKQLATRSVEKDNSSIPDVDIRFHNTEFMAEGSTFLWFPWTLAELSQLSVDESLSQDERKAAAGLRSEILNANFDKLENYVETANLMYMFAEHLLCVSAYLETTQPGKNPKAEN